MYRQISFLSVWGHAQCHQHRVQRIELLYLRYIVVSNAPEVVLRRRRNENSGGLQLVQCPVRSSLDSTAASAQPHDCHIPSSIDSFHLILMIQMLSLLHSPVFSADNDQSPSLSTHFT